MKILSGSLILILFSGIMGCARSETKPQVTLLEPNAELGVIGGQKMLPNSELASKVIGLYDRKSRSICTGTLIAVDTVLTAAHCVNPESKELDIVFATHFAGAGWPHNSRIIRAHSFRRHPKYDPKRSSGSDTFDLAIVHFKSEIPKPYQVVNLNQSAPLDLALDTRLTAAGFGYSNPYFRLGSGTLRAVQISFHQMHSRTEIQTKQGETGVCFGDSGGPLFQQSQGQWIQIGVASRVAPRTLFCWNYAVYTRVDLYLDWMFQTAEELRALNESR